MIKFKNKLSIFFILLICLNGYSQKTNLENRLSKCYSEETNLSIALCTRHIADSLNLEISKKYNFIINKLDSAINQHSKNILINTDTENISFSKQQINYFKNIKSEFIISQNTFSKYLEVEIEFIGNLTDTGKARTIIENSREIELLDERLKYFDKLIYNNF